MVKCHLDQRQGACQERNVWREVMLLLMMADGPRSLDLGIRWAASHDNCRQGYVGTNSVVGTDGFCSGVVVDYGLMMRMLTSSPSLFMARLGHSHVSFHICFFAWRASSPVPGLLSPVPVPVPPVHCGQIGFFFARGSYRRLEGTV